MPQDVDALMCPGLDIGSEALPNHRGYSRHPFGSTVNHKLNLPAWRKPYAEALLETDSERLLTMLAATEIIVFQRLLDLAPDQDA